MSLSAILQFDIHWKIINWWESVSASARILPIQLIVTSESVFSQHSILLQNWQKNRKSSIRITWRIFIFRCYVCRRYVTHTVFTVNLFFRYPIRCLRLQCLRHMDIPIKWFVICWKASLIRFLFNCSFLWAPGNNKKQQKVKMFISAASRIAPVARTAVSTTQHLCMWWNFHWLCEVKKNNLEWRMKKVRPGKRVVFNWNSKVIEKFAVVIDCCGEKRVHHLTSSRLYNCHVVKIFFFFFFSILVL